MGIPLHSASSCARTKHSRSEDAPPTESSAPGGRQRDNPFRGRAGGSTAPTQRERRSLTHIRKRDIPDDLALFMAKEIKQAKNPL